MAPTAVIGRTGLVLESRCRARTLTLKVSKRCNCLRWQRYDVRRPVQLSILPTLHARRGHRPRRRIEVELRPLRVPKLARAKHQPRREEQGSANYRRPSVSVARAQQFAEAHRIRDRREVPPRLHRPQRVFQILCWIARCALTGHREAEHLRAILECAVRGLDNVPCFHAANHGQQLSRRDLADRASADIRKDIGDQTREGLGAVCCRPACSLEFVPLVRDGFKRGRSAGPRPPTAR